ncbi:MAG: protein kinase domain-containing protein [Gemmatimonadales bacterium]
MADSLARLQSIIGDRYRIQRELGHGGMATVYLATDLKHGRPVAVKVLRAELAHAIGPERFLREIEIAARLSHPNILPLHDSGEADGLLYYVMPYVEGESLRDHLDRERHLPLDEAVRIARNVADALTHAHTHGVVHRDIKPENVLLSGGQFVVADFGIARAADAAGTRLTETGLALGTPAYMSPEQSSGERGADARSDIYSLGCLVYEMLGGEPPFTGPTAQAVMARHAIDPVPSLRTLRPTVPQGVERVVQKALAKVPADRFATADQFATQLARASTAESIAAETRRARSARRRRTWGTAAGVLLLGAGGWWVSGMVEEPAIRRLAVLPLANLTNDPEQEYFAQGMHDALISELAQAGVPVIGRTSVMQYQQTIKPAREITRELNADAVVEASVARSGDSVFIRAQLVDGGTEQTLWAGAYAGDLRSVQALHRQVTRAIAGEVRSALTPEAEARLSDAQPVNPEAYEAYLKGMFHWRRATPQDLETAEQYFRLALTRDPGYALAHAGIALVWVARQQNGYVAASKASPLAKAAAARALALDSTLADVHFTLAGIRCWTDWDWKGAESSFRRAIALNPNGPQSRAYYSHLLHILGRPKEAMAQIDLALKLDPLNPLFQGLYAMDLMYARRFDDAIALLQETLKTEPHNAVALATLRSAYHQKAMYPEALDVWKASFLAKGDAEAAEALARGSAEAGYSGALTRVAELLTARSRTSHVTPWQIGTLYTRAGKNEAALDWLEKAYQARDPNMPYLSVDPIFDELRSDPRFQDLLRRMDLLTPGGPHAARVGG